GVVIVGLSIGTIAYNWKLNDRELHKPDYELVSKPTGLIGHIEYIVYKNGSKDLKIYPGLGHKLFSSEFYQDLNGDGKVDIIRENAPTWKLNKLDYLLVREHDYQTNKEKFDEADRKLQEAMAKY
ncbi:MAG: hypothetical protein QW703_01500, partial [Candidatus Aenigmatarchaeota archaeon]